MKPHYFRQEQADYDDQLLAGAKDMGYVPRGCLLGGELVLLELWDDRDPCANCLGPRQKCGGRPNEE